jgi:hydrogenase nickel incorporation protein HypA/HybF
MHELGIAMEIADLAAQRAGDGRVRRVIVDVGQLTAVLPDALAFAWDAAIEGSMLEGAVLEIVVVPGRGKCKACGSEHALTMPFGRCTCGTELDLIAGEDLRVRALEVT